MKTNKNKENGKFAENLFSEYLNDNEIPFYLIDQKIETYSDHFSHNEIRRPDFIIHLKKGIFHIDVKYRKKKNFGENNEKRFYLNRFEMRGLTNFQNEFNSDIWISFTENLEKPDFHYISISSINEYFENLYNTIGYEFYNTLDNDKIESNKYYERFFYFFPDNLFYHNLSNEKGFFMKNIDQNYFTKEAEYHKNIWKKL
jgi:hypothetical protein